MELESIVTLILGAGVGFFFNMRLHKFKSHIDSGNRYKEYRHKLKIEYLENKLRIFLSPIIYAIEFDNETWEKVSALSDSDSVYPDSISEYMEKEYILKNHARAVELVRENMHFLDINCELHKELVKYIRHVAVFQSIRALGEVLNPIDVGEPFPNNLHELMKIEYKNTQKEYERLINSPK